MFLVDVVVMVVMTIVVGGMVRVLIVLGVIVVLGVVVLVRVIVRVLVF